MTDKIFRPWKPAPYELADIQAIQQLAQGTASPEMQRRALQWIVESVAMTHDLPYIPDSERDSCFAQGKMFVGMQIKKALRLNTSVLLQREKQLNDNRESGRDPSRTD